MNLQKLLKSRIALALFVGLVYLTWKSLAQYFGLDESIGGFGTDAIGLGAWATEGFLHPEIG